jgi:hypothetical protein
MGDEEERKKKKKKKVLVNFLLFGLGPARSVKLSPLLLAGPAHYTRVL